MIKTLIVYEDGMSGLEDSAKLIASLLQSHDHEVRLRAASAVSIPDILASKLYILGAESADSPSYEEMARVFTGINLAGRSAAYFGPTAKPLSSLKKMAADAELRTAVSDLVDPRPGPDTVAAWLRNLP